MRILNRAVVAAALAVSAVVALAAPAQADPIDYTFTNLTNNSGSASTFATYMTMSVSASTTSSGAGVRFSFTNDYSDGEITEIYWDTSSGTAGQGPNNSPTGDTGSAFLGAFTAQAPVSGSDTWGQPANPANVPSANSAIPPFVWDLHTDEKQGNDDGPGGTSLGGIEADETAWFEFSLLGSTTFQDVIDALNDESLRVAFHARSFGAYSESFMNDPNTTISTIVPEPASIALVALGLGGVFFQRRRRLRIHTN